MYKIIACDLDETLLSDDRSISKEISKRFKKLKNWVLSLFLLQEEDTIRLMEL